MKIFTYVAATLLVPLALLLSAAPGMTDQATARAELRQLHKSSLQAHKDGDWKWFGDNMGDEYVLAFDGEIQRPTREETLRMFEHYFSSTTFSKYDDVVEPVIHVSADGTLGTVLVQVHVLAVMDEGKDTEVRTDATWTWINTWQKIDGRWLLQTNVSNMHDGPPE